MSTEPEPASDVKYTNVIGETVKSATTTLSPSFDLSWLNQQNQKITSPNDSWIVETQKPDPTKNSTVPTGTTVTMVIVPPTVD